MALSTTTPSPAQIAILETENNDKKIYVYVIIFTVLAVFATAIRVTSRHTKKKALIGLDDILVMAALVLSVAQNIYIAIGATKYGVGRHLLTLRPDQLVNFQKLWYTVGLLEPTIMAVTKLSIVILYQRIFVTRTFRIWTWIVGSFIALWWFGNFFGDALICIPVRKNWEPDTPGHCGNKHLLFILPPIAGIFTDAVLLIMPLPMLRTLHVPRLQKFGLAGLFFLGGFATVASCIRYSTLFFTEEDVTYDITTATIWTVVESNVTIISACLIVSRPFFVKIYPQRLISLVQGMSSSSNKPHSDKKRWWNKSTPGHFISGHFKPLSDTPPAVTDVSLGGPFELDIEKNWDPHPRTRRADMEGIEY